MRWHHLQCLSENIAGPPLQRWRFWWPLEELFDLATKRPVN